MGSTVLTLISFVSRIETIVEIQWLVVKIDIVLIEGILTKILEESKIGATKIVEHKTSVLTTEEVKTGEIKTEVLNSIDEGGIYSSVDEVESLLSMMC